MFCYFPLENQQNMPFHQGCAHFCTQLYVTHDEDTTCDVRTIWPAAVASSFYKAVGFVDGERNINDLHNDDFVVCIQ